jgi:hypothetical protein
MAQVALEIHSAVVPALHEGFFFVHVLCDFAAERRMMRLSGEPLPVPNLGFHSRCSLLVKAIK